MLNQIGSIIGKVRHSFSITNDAKEKVNLSIIVDFTSTSDTDIMSWLCSNRVIAGQRPWRSLSLDELYDLDDTTFIAQRIGQKVKSRSEKVAELESLGLPSKVAITAVDDPKKYAKVMETLETLLDNEVDDDSDDDQEDSDN